MHTLIIALLKLAVNINVLDVEYAKVLENFILGPAHEDWILSCFIQLRRLVLVLHLLLQLVHRLLQLQIVGSKETQQKFNSVKSE